jgi:hypothetical protein
MAVQVRRFLARVDAAVHLGQRHRQQEQRGQLGGEGLGRGDADLGPARVRNFSAASRTMADSGTLQMARVRDWPSTRACLSAARVSAVSPDCEMATTSASGFGTELR